ncbi:Maltose O-acetyltransferase [Pseudocercospora fuligena]|uniref:Maltose O-acetyltransferase n=1 Tax=Pseudocercospora fuligena TaxID=685502 RepID=A0A8H6RD15_9PEZI|nr:Maltose O-acetyltransferase [Pseudocercospora fuligena]
MPLSENHARSLRGEMHYAFTPELIKLRDRTHEAIVKYNNANTAELSRRKRVELWNKITQDPTPLPPQAATEEEDDLLFAEHAWVEPPFHADYGTNISLGKNVFINFNCTIIDTCKVTIGARTLFAPGVSLYSGCHPLDPEVRNGTKGPEMGAEIHIEEDCWIGGQAIILPGITIGKGSVVGAGSVVTKNVPPYTVVAGNPAKKIKDAPRNTNEEVTSGALEVVTREAGEDQSWRQYSADKQ